MSSLKHLTIANPNMSTSAKVYDVFTSTVSGGAGGYLGGIVSFYVPTPRGGTTAGGFVGGYFGNFIKGVLHGQVPCYSDNFNAGLVGAGGGFIGEFVLGGEGFVMGVGIGVATGLGSDIWKGASQMADESFESGQEKRNDFERKVNQGY